MKGWKYKIISLIALVLSFLDLNGTHLVGGFMSYRYLGTNGSFHNYRVTLYVYRDCSRSDPVPFDKEISVCIYDGNSFYKDVTINLIRERDVAPLGSTNCPEATSACLKQGFYEGNVAVRNSNNGFHIRWERCCRNTQVNLTDGSDGDPNQGQTYYAFIPPTSIRNSSPFFTDTPVPFICLGDTTNVSMFASDPDGDSLVYRFVTPWQGASTSDPILETCDQNYFQSGNVIYKAGYNTAQPFGSSGLALIDRSSGITTYLSRQLGRFAVCVEVLEYRNGRLLSAVRLDLQVLVINCKPNNRPNLSFEGGVSTYNIEVGEQLCRNIIGTDPDANQNVTVRANGDILDGTNNYTGPRATLTPNPAIGLRTATTRLCWKPDCNQARTDPYLVLAGATDNGCPFKSQKQTLRIFVRPFVPNEFIVGPNPVCQNSNNNVYRVNTVGVGRTYKWRAIGGMIDGDSVGSSIKINWGNGVSGKVIVWVTSRFGCTSNPIEYNITLQPAPNKPVVAGPDTVCLNSQSNFTATTDPSVTLLWSSFGGNIISGQGTRNIGVFWNRKGTGAVKLVVTNSVGCKSPADSFVVFVSHPNTSNIQGPNSVCPNNGNISYSVSPVTNGSLYRWFVTGGSIASGNNSGSVRVNWGGKGIGLLKVVEINKFGCVGDTQYLTVKIDHALDGQLPTGDTSICEFTTNQVYSISAITGETYNWIVTGGTITSGQGTARITVDWGIAGLGSVGVQSTAFDPINNLPCSSPVRARIVNIRKYPTPRVLQGVFDLCQTPQLGAFSISPNFANSTFEWEVVNLPFSGQGTNTINIDLDTFGSFLVRVRETTEFNCVGPWNDTLLVLHPKPRTSPLSGNFVICFPRISNYNYSVNGFPNSVYRWWNRGGNFNGTTNTNTVNVDWVGNPINEIGVQEISEFGCLGDSLRREVFIDNPTISTRLVTTEPPPAGDKNVLLYYRLNNAPRYNNSIIVQRRISNSGNNFVTIGAASPTGVLYTDFSALTDSHAYEYRVVAVNLCGDSLYSNPQTDVLLRGNRTSPFTMRLSFTDYLGWPNGVQRYELYRALENRSGYALYATYSAPGTFDFDNGRDHYGQIFRVKAIGNDTGQVSWSNDIVIYYEPVLFVPNAFTPDQSGLNDYFLPVASGMKTYSFKIFSRWGEKLYESSGTETGWDGKYKGKPVADGVYVYTITYSDFRNKEYSAKGTFHLLR